MRDVSLRRLFAETLSEMFRNVARHINPLNATLNPICHLLALLGAHHILHVSRIRVNVKPLNRNSLRVIPSFRGDGLLRPKYLGSKIFTV